MTTADRRVEAIETRTDLVIFIAALRRGLDIEQDSWENSTLESYLEALQAVLQDWPGRCRNRGEAVPAQPTWRLIAELLLAASIYE